MNEKSKQEWHAITVTLPKEGSDWISHLLFELGSTGNLEEEAPDPTLIAMKGYFPSDLGPSNALIQQINELLRNKGIEPLSIFSTTIKLQNWAEAAQQLFSPIKILDDVTIINPWSDYKARTGEKVVVVNPGMAFGTGYHATTQLAARLIADTISRHKIETMCDVGSGSAILSIIAAKNGVKKIDAVEIDSDARKSSLENIETNGCKSKIKLFGKIDDACGKYDLVVANILFSIITELKEDLIQRVKDGQHLIISGITSEEDEKFLKEYEDTRIELSNSIEQDGWKGYIFKSKTNPKS